MSRGGGAEVYLPFRRGHCACCLEAVNRTSCTAKHLQCAAYPPALAGPRQPTHPANPHAPASCSPEYNPEDPEIIDLLSRDPRKKGEGAQHPFQSAMDDCLMITIKGIAAGG